MSQRSCCALRDLDRCIARHDLQKLKSIQQQTLQLYHRLKAADMVPKELDSRRGTPSKADEGISSAAETSEVDAEARNKIIAVMRRCGVTKGSLGLRLLFVLWHKWAKRRGVAPARDQITGEMAR